jgi:hypothetical protein
MAAAQLALAHFIHSMGRQTIPNPVFSVVPDKLGSISRGQFERLLLHNIGNEAVGLFGILIPEKPDGDPTQKDSSAIAPGHDICIDIGADAFHRLLFCPNLLDSSQGIDSLPPTCGSSNGLTKDGITLTSVRDTFQVGHIDIDATLEKSGFCYHAYGSFHSTITLSMGGSVVTSNVAVDPPSVNVDVPWYCYLAAGFLGTIGLVIGGIVSTSVEFNGDIVIMSGGYQDKLAMCAREALIEISRIHTKPQQVPVWVPVNYPAPDQVIQLVRGLVEASSVEADNLLVHAMLAHGASFDRALFSREAVGLTGRASLPTSQTGEA